MTYRRAADQMDRRQVLFALASGSAGLAGAGLATAGRGADAAELQAGGMGDVAPDAAPPDVDEFLRVQQRGQLSALRTIWDALDSPAALVQYQQRVRREFMEVLGPWPAAEGPPPVERAGQIERVGYTLEKLLLESQRGFWVPVNLYVPDESHVRPAPAVICPPGHAPAGKAHRERDSYQHLFITLAKAGFVVCAFDPLGQGEREPYGAATGNHHGIQGLQCLSSARHLASYFLNDARRCLDYLATRNEVDMQRIGCAGCSGGGAVTQYLAALDERIRAAVAASWITSTPILTEDDGLHVESWFPRLATPYGAGTLQLAACIAPRPLLILGNHDDAEFPPGPMQAVFREVKALYERVEAAGPVEYVDAPTRHGFWPAARVEVYQFLHRQLQPTDAVWTREHWEELDAAAEPEEEASLECAPSGQVRNLAGAKTVFDLNREEMGVLRRERQSRRVGDSRAWETQVREGLSRLWPDRELPQKATSELLGEGRMSGVPYRRFLVKFTDGEATWIDIYSPPERPPNVTFVVADDMQSGAAFSAALRAAGDCVWHVHGFRARERREYMVGEYRAFRWARMLTAAARTRSGWPGEGVPRVERLAGIGPFAAWAVQLAPLAEEHYLRLANDAAREDSSSRLTQCAILAAEPLLSLAAFCDEAGASHSMLATPGQWRWFDEADIAALLGARPVWIAAARDSRGRLVEVEAMERHYDWALRRREKRGTALRLTRTMPDVDNLADWRGGR
ncbi:MAG: acetylxylan esterase [Pirellulales bacterium]